jgi:ATP-dependent RNA helicase DeaD
VMIELISDQKAPASLSHYFTEVKPQQRFEKLLELIETEQPKQAIFFCSSRNSCEKLYDHLKGKIKSVEQIHGGLDQNRRTSLFRRFKRLDIQYLVATDIASRGLDFSHTTHIFNYDLPHNPEAYTHRTGRTARMGREGKAITFIGLRDLGKLKHILKANRITPQWIGPAPDLSRSSGKADPCGTSSRGKGPHRGDSPRKNFRGRRPSRKPNES